MMKGWNKKINNIYFIKGLVINYIIRSESIRKNKNNNVILSK